MMVRCQVLHGSYSRKIHSRVHGNMLYQFAKSTLSNSTNHAVVVVALWLFNVPPPWAEGFSSTATNIGTKHCHTDDDSIYVVVGPHGVGNFQRF